MPSINTEHVLKIGQAQAMFDGFGNKTDSRYLKNADKGALATKDEVAKTDLASALSDEISNATSNISTINGKVSTLIGSDTNKSVRTIANEELAAQLIPENAQEALDTLQEIAAWIQEHPEEAAAINAKLELGTYDDNGTQKQYATVKAYVEAYVAAQAYTHPAYTATTGAETANATPAFGGTFSVSQVTTDATGHVTGQTERTVTIPGATAVASVSGVGGSNGLMTASDKEKLDGFEFATTSEVQAVIDGMFTESAGE